MKWKSWKRKLLTRRDRKLLAAMRRPVQLELDWESRFDEFWISTLHDVF